jgi:hypothetical protein
MLETTQRQVGSGRILLLDLVWTLAIRRRGPSGRNYAEVIAETETYADTG